MIIFLELTLVFYPMKFVHLHCAVLMDCLWTVLCLQLSNDIGYVLYSALGSFYIPSCIMVFVYIRIYYAAKARARRNIRKPPPKMKATEKDTSFTRREPVTSPVDKNSNNSPVAVTIEKPVIPVVTCDFASDISTSDNVDMPETSKETLQVSVSIAFSFQFSSRCRYMSLGGCTNSYKPKF